MGEPMFKRSSPGYPATGKCSDDLSQKDRVNNKDGGKGSTSLHVYAMKENINFLATAGISS
jgi:hypothetical protein